MGRSRPKEPLDQAGAFLSDGRGMIAVPIRTLSDEYRDEPTEPEDDHEPEPESPGRTHRALEWLKGRLNPRR